MKLKKKIKNYLLNNNINNLEQLTDHIEELKVSKELSIDDRDMLFKLVYCVCNKKDCLLSFFAENNKPRESFWRTNTTNGYKITAVNVITNKEQREKLNKVRKFIADNDTTQYGESWKSQEELSNEAIKKYGSYLKNETLNNVGKKESQTKEKAPIFTYCKQMKNAIELLALRSLYGHNKYEKGDDWENFSRVENGDFEYANASFRHALEIGGEETEKEHLIASAWNSIARLEIYLRNENRGGN